MDKGLKEYCEAMPGEPKDALMSMRWIPRPNGFRYGTMSMAMRRAEKHEDHVLNYAHGFKRAAQFSALALELEVEMIPQARTAMPKSSVKRVLFDRTVPSPMPVTMLAWQSICEIMSGSFLTTHDEFVRKTLESMSPDDSEDLIAPATPLACGLDSENLYWSCLCIPTLMESFRDNNSPGTIPKNTSAIADQYGYGVHQMALIRMHFDRESRRYSWRQAILDGEHDTMLPGIIMLAMLLKQADVPPGLRTLLIERLGRFWQQRPRGNGGSSDWAAPSFKYAPSQSHNPDSRAMTFTPAFGIDTADISHQHFARLYADHGIGFRFSTAAASSVWLDGYRKSIETQLDWLLARNPEWANCLGWPQERAHKPTAAEIERSVDSDMITRMKEPINPGELITDLESIKNVLGI